MKRVIFVLLLCTASVVVRAREMDSRQDSLLVMFWNLENFFDWTDQGTGPSDKEFSSYGDRFWTRRKFYAKCNAVAKSVFWIADRYERMPDVIGLAEIENRGVLVRLLNATLLRKYDYSIVHFESSDRRGIDVALLYRTSSLELLSTSVCTPYHDGMKMKTRDMLHCRMRRCHAGKGILSDTLDFIVCHHPSKFSGARQSEDRRDAAMIALRQLCDSLGNGCKVVMGDFNDTPDAARFDRLDHVLVNKADNLYAEGRGTIRYKGEWELIDMFLTDRDSSYRSVMDIVHVPFLMTYDRSYPGEKPLRTYSGPRYLGGVSDHCPVVLHLSR